MSSTQLEAEKLEDYGHMFSTRPRTRIVYVLIPHAPLLVNREFLDAGGFSRYVHVSSCKIESGESVAKKTFAVRNTNGVTLNDLVSGIRQEMKHSAWPFVILLDRKRMKQASDALGLVFVPYWNQEHKWKFGTNSRGCLDNVAGQENNARLWCEEIKSFIWPIE